MYSLKERNTFAIFLKDSLFFYFLKFISKTLKGELLKGKEQQQQHTTVISFNKWK